MTASPALWCVPGLGLDEVAWRPTLTALSGTDSHVAPLSGYGEPAAGDADLTPAALAAALVDRWLPPGSRAVMAGHSASCQVVAEAAALAPDRVAGLVLVGPTTDPRARSWPALARRWLATARHERPGQVPTLVRQYARTGPGSMARAMAAARHHRIEDALARVGCPVLVLRGRHDRICPPDWLRSVADSAGTASSASLAAGAHMVPLTHGRLVAEAVAAFLPGTA